VSNEGRNLRLAIEGMQKNSQLALSLCAEEIDILRSCIVFFLFEKTKGVAEHDQGKGEKSSLDAAYHAVLGVPPEFTDETVEDRY
jgi:hypothetical protein